MSAKTLRAAEIAELLGVVTNSTSELSRVSGLEGAGPDAVVFAEDVRTLAAAIETGAGLILARVRAAQADERVLIVKDPRYAFALCAKALAGVRTGREVHPSAAVDASAKVGERVKIGPRAVVEADVTLGDDVEIAAGAVILHGVEIGNRVVVQAGAVLGAAGFGYARDAKTGEHLLFPQQGRLVIEDDVEIGANTTIDRGALGETRIGRGTKIDNLCHIAHNCVIGEDVIMAAQVGMAGSCVIEDGAMLGGQVGLGERVTIGKGVILGGQGGVLPGKKIDGEGVVYWGTPAQPVREYLRGLARMRKG